MGPGKINLNFHHMDTTGGFTTGPDNPLIHVKFLDNSLDMTKKTFVCNRFLRVDAGYWTPEAHAHAYWEELYILEGDIISIDADGERAHKRRAKPVSL